MNHVEISWNFIILSLIGDWMWLKHVDKSWWLSMIHDGNMKFSVSMIDDGNHGENQGKSWENYGGNIYKWRFRSRGKSHVKGGFSSHNWLPEASCFKVLMNFWCEEVWISSSITWITAEKFLASPKPPSLDGKWSWWGWLGECRSHLLKTPGGKTWTCCLWKHTICFALSSTLLATCVVPFWGRSVSHLLNASTIQHFR